ncbi:F-box protein At2g26850 isoform X1 [Cryptomeria japonica]|uniref:F-box protein At2g26850 isoform X1 n=1 Tax=Cryptomeria japonica TaxID=3369 RepID=UPI0027DA70C9|nr:F-box protein At2g26850 isoform X1 [Cryptomeria japonica]
MLLRNKSKQAKSAKDNSANSACPLLDLPEFVLESILRRLSPYHLCQLAQTSKDLRKRCRRDEIWEPLYKERWGKIAGMNAFDLWRRLLFQRDSWILESKLIKAVPVIRPNEVFVNLYWQLECGEFWFPGQVFRQQGHAGFEACYDAILEYDRNSDTFRARYLSRSASNIVNGISWERIRKPPVMTSPSELYIPDVLNELRPGDHIEIQWRMNQNWPYEWWYAIVGHADNCISENQNCSCHLDEMFWIEFRQYPVGSTWRRFQIRRNRATEVGSASDGFYGGIRKLTNMEDINAWLQPSLESDGQWSF